MLLDDVYDFQFKYFTILINVMHGWMHENMPALLHIELGIF